MRFGHASGTGLSGESDSVEARRDIEPAVIALIDRNGHRHLVPVDPRNRRTGVNAASAPHRFIGNDPEFMSGTIH